MGNRQEQSGFVDRVLARDQVVGHAQGLRHCNAGIAPCQDKFHLAQKQFLKGLGEVWRTREGQLLLGYSAEFRGQSRLFRQSAGMTVQVLDVVVDQR
ncbi:hypothetical protein D3C73_1239830 [compost metagenome]